MMDLPLKNKTFVITRDRHQAKGLIHRLSELGGHTIAFPTIKIVEPEDWNPCDSVLLKIEDFDWIVFSSVNSVRYFFSRCQVKGVDIHNVRARIATVGTKTREEVQRFDVDVELTPASYSAKRLLEEFLTFDMRGKKILFPASDIARDTLETGLENMGTEVSKVVVYRNIPNRENDPEAFKKKLKDGKIDCLVFFSPSSVHYLVEIIDDSVLMRIRESSLVVAAIGPTTAQALQKEGIKPDILPEQSTEEALVTAILNYFKVPIE